MRIRIRMQRIKRLRKENARLYRLSILIQCMYRSMHLKPDNFLYSVF